MDATRKILLALVAVAALRLPTLGRYDLNPWDEPFYALRARAAAEAGAWLDQNDYCPNRMANACYPPLFIWLAGATMKILGPTEFAARLWAALLGVAAVPLAYAVAARLFDKRAGLFTAAALALLPYFTRVSRMAQFDAPLAFFLLLTFWAWLEFGRTRRLATAALAGVAFGLALLTKIAVPFVFVAAAGLALLFSPGEGMTRRRAFAGLALASAVGLALAAPWHVYMYAAHGRYFLEHYLGYMVLYRGDGIAPHIEAPRAPLVWLYYADYATTFLKGVAAFFFAGLFALAFAPETWRRRPDRLVVVLWVVLALVVLTATRFKREVYLTVLLAPMCVLAAPWLARLAGGKVTARGAGLLAGGALLAAYWADAARARAPIAALITPDLVSGRQPWGPLAAGAAGAALLGLGFALWYRKAPRAAAAVLLALVFGHLAAGSAEEMVKGRRDWRPLKAVLDRVAYPGVVMITAEESPTHLFYLYRLMPGFGGAEPVTLNPEYAPVKVAGVTSRYRRGYLVLWDKKLDGALGGELAAAMEADAAASVSSPRFTLFYKPKALTAGGP